jgi:hypothetical protein
MHDGHPRYAEHSDQSDDGEDRNDDVQKSRPGEHGVLLYRPYADGMTDRPGTPSSPDTTSAAQTRYDLRSVPDQSGWSGLSGSDRVPRIMSNIASGHISMQAMTMTIGQDPWN